MSGTYLFGDSHAVNLAPHFRARLGAGFGSQAVSGSHTTDWPTKIASQIAVSRPGVVLVCLGSNDRHIAASSLRSATQRIVTAASGSTLLWIGPPDMPDVNEDIAISAIRPLVPYYFDSRSLSLTFSRSDRIHPTSASYKIWADAVIDRLNKMPSGARARETPLPNPDNDDRPANETDAALVSKVVGGVTLALILGTIVRR